MIKRLQKQLRRGCTGEIQTNDLPITMSWLARMDKGLGSEENVVLHQWASETNV